MTTPERISIDVGGMNFDALASGPTDGRLVVLLHGFPQTSHSMRRQVEHLGDNGYRAVAPDQRGYSPGARPEGIENYSVDHLVSDVLAMADQMGGHRIDLVGHDWGAIVAWHVAAKFPERLRTVTPISVPHPSAFAKALADPEADQRERSGYVTFFQTPDAPEQFFLADEGAALRALYVGSGIAEDDADVYVRHFLAPGAMTAALNWYRALDFAGASLDDVTVPTMFVWSTDDTALGREGAEATEEHVRGPYRFEVLERINHWIPEMAPDELNRLLLEHLGADYS